MLWCLHQKWQVQLWSQETASVIIAAASGNHYLLELEWLLQEAETAIRVANQMIFELSNEIDSVLVVEHKKELESSTSAAARLNRSFWVNLKIPFKFFELV